MTDHPTSTIQPHVLPEPAVWLTHGSARLALHHLRTATARPELRLLCLHGLGEATGPLPPEVVEGWPGEIWGLDFTGHGRSSIPGGGGYTAEVLMADVDHALAHLGPCTLLGRGLGAYVALLAAGGRAELVRGAILTDGTGLAGGGPSPHTAAIIGPAPGADFTATPDPYALAELSRDIRPADYATTYARLAVEYSGLDEPIAVACVVRPPWLSAVVDEPGVLDTSVTDALTRYAANPPDPSGSSALG